MKSFKLGVIGCGNMGTAIIRGAVGRGILRPVDITIYDKDTAKMSRVVSAFGCRRGDITSVIKRSDYVLIAVKPQDSPELLKKIKGNIRRKTVISVMAGVRISSIIRQTGDKRLSVVRAMPNMGALIGQSVTCVAFGRDMAGKKPVKALFSGIGEVLEVQEKALDAVTAVSGSGPAYLFYLADAMISAARNNGLDMRTAKELVIQTLYGSSSLLRTDRKLDPSDLVKKVASKGGTTEAALAVLDAGKVKKKFIEAVTKARKRSEKLSGR